MPVESQRGLRFLDTVPLPLLLDELSSPRISQIFLLKVIFVLKSVMECCYILCAMCSDHRSATNSWFLNNQVLKVEVLFFLIVINIHREHIVFTDYHLGTFKIWLIKSPCCLQAKVCLVQKNLCEDRTTRKHFQGCTLIRSKFQLLKLVQLSNYFCSTGNILTSQLQLSNKNKNNMKIY